MAASVDAVGFVFAPSKRRVTPQRALELTRGVPATISRVAVMQHPEQAMLDEVHAVFRPDVLQIDIEDIETLRMPAGMYVTPVVRAGRQMEAVPTRLLFEGPVSGTGQTADWSEAARLARCAQLILAGGLNPTNVADAIRIVQPFGVDVSSGVERAPGSKDPKLIAEFVKAARSER